MARRLSWSDVRGGAIAIVVIAVVIAITFKYSRVGALHGDTLVLRARFGEARGILVGSEVWLSGQKVGKVTRIAFRPPQADTSSRLEIEMLVLAMYRPNIHRDAVAQIRAGGSFIGQPVVYLSPGTIRAEEIRDGDTLTTHAQADVETAAARMSVASRQLPEIIGNVKVLSAQLHGTQGTLGAFLNAPDAGILGSLRRTQREVTRLQATIARPAGGVSYVTRGDLAARAQVVLARADSVRSLVASPSTSLGRFRRDSTLVASVHDIQAQLDTVHAMLADARGTAGRAMQDSALTVAVGEARTQLTLLMADLKKHPLRYLF